MLIYRREIFLIKQFIRADEMITMFFRERSMLNRP